MLAGNLGMSLALDYVFYGTFSLLRAVGIFLILTGMAWVEKEKKEIFRSALELMKLMESAVESDN